MTDEEMSQTAHELFCELSPNSKSIAVGILRLLLVEEAHPF